MFAENELKRKCINLSNFTSWKVKNKRMSIFVKIVFMSAILSSAYFSSQSPRTEFKLLVHYSYFEGKHTPYCEVLLKRLNLGHPKRVSTPFFLVSREKKRGTFL